MSNSDHLHERLRQMKARVAIQKWEARQIDHAGGVWFHLQLLFASTRRALVITADEAEGLRNSGFEPHPIGSQLEPPKSFFVLSEEMVPPGVGAEVPLQEAQRILLAPAAILIPFRRNTHLL
jgi:hypothetical protein